MDAFIGILLVFACIAVIFLLARLVTKHTNHITESVKVPQVSEGKRPPSNINPRLVSGILFGLVLVIELIILFAMPDVTSTIKVSDTLFGSRETVVDDAATMRQTVTMLAVLGVTAIIGSIVTFAIPNNSQTKDPH